MPGDAFARMAYVSGNARNDILSPTAVRLEASPPCTQIDDLTIASEASTQALRQTGAFLTDA
jgi:hypothetical protein